jgi:AcrR family transcriptional regulator
LRAEDRRELIVEAALQEFAERGYDGASIGRIAAAAGTARTVLYDHFPSKFALYDELLRTEHAELLGYLREALASEGSTEQRWRATFDAYFRFVEEHPLAWRLLYPANPPTDPDAFTEFRRLAGESNRVLAGLLAADARRAGLDPDSVVARAVFLMHRDALAAAARWWRSHPEVSRAELVDGAIAALWTGFGGLQPSGAPES